VYSIFPSTQTGWILCLILGVAIPFFGEIQTRWLRWGSNRIATYSYGVYLSHQFCIWFVADILGLWPAWIKMPVLAVLLIGIPISLYYAIEKPMIRIGIRLTERWNTRRVTAAATA
jgi:peptidoglycan/LPS O-acetylase OafA/YrhL